MAMCVDRDPVTGPARARAHEKRRADLAALAGETLHMRIVAYRERFHPSVLGENAKFGNQCQRLAYVPDRLIPLLKENKRLKDEFDAWPHLHIFFDWRQIMYIESNECELYKGHSHFEPMLTFDDCSDVVSNEYVHVEEWANPFKPMPMPVASVSYPPAAGSKSPLAADSESLSRWRGKSLEGSPADFAHEPEIE